MESALTQSAEVDKSQLWDIFNHEISKRTFKAFQKVFGKGGADAVPVNDSYRLHEVNATNQIQHQLQQVNNLLLHNCWNLSTSN